MFNSTDIPVLYIFVDKLWRLLTYHYHVPSYHELLQSCQLSETLRFFATPCIYVTFPWATHYWFCSYAACVCVCVCAR